MPNNPLYRAKLSADHRSNFHGRIYSLAGDVVEVLDGRTFQGQSPECSGAIIIYRDATGERFACCATLLQKVADTIPVKKQKLSTKKP